MNTDELIANLSAKAAPIKAMKPRRYATFLLCILLVYAVCTQCWLEGFRPDLSAQLMRPLFVIELLLLVSMLISAALATVYAMFPDGSQHQWLMKSPYLFSGGMIALVMMQLFLPQDVRMVMPDATAHTHECTTYIAYASILPTLLIFGLLRKGASVMPMQAGALAVIAAISVSALTLRLAEANDEISHLLIWHYLPTIIFASIGAGLGRFLLRW